MSVRKKPYSLLLYSSRCECPAQLTGVSPQCLQSCKLCASEGMRAFVSEKAVNLKLLLKQEYESKFTSMTRCFLLIRCTVRAFVLLDGGLPYYKEIKVFRSKKIVICFMSPGKDKGNIIETLLPTGSTELCRREWMFCTGY